MNYKRYAVVLTKWGHDVNGNPIARHTVRAYSEASAPLTAPDATLYTSRRGQQTGTSAHRDDWAPSALRLAGLPANLTLTKTEGDRHTGDGTMYLIYDAPQGAAA